MAVDVQHASPAGGQSRAAIIHQLSSQLISKAAQNPESMYSEIPFDIANEKLMTVDENERGTIYELLAKYLEGSWTEPVPAIPQDPTGVVARAMHLVHYIRQLLTRLNGAAVQVSFQFPIAEDSALLKELVGGVSSPAAALLGTTVRSKACALAQAPTEPAPARQGGSVTTSGATAPGASPERISLPAWPSVNERTAENDAVDRRVETVSAKSKIGKRKRATEDEDGEVGTGRSSSRAVRSRRDRTNDGALRHSGEAAGREQGNDGDDDEVDDEEAEAARDQQDGKRNGEDGGTGDGNADDDGDDEGENGADEAVRGPGDLTSPTGTVARRQRVPSDRTKPLETTGSNGASQRGSSNSLEEVKRGPDHHTEGAVIPFGAAVDAGISPVTAPLVDDHHRNSDQVDPSHGADDDLNEDGTELIPRNNIPSGSGKVSTLERVSNAATGDTSAAEAVTKVPKPARSLQDCIEDLFGWNAQDEALDRLRQTFTGGDASQKEVSIMQGALSESDAIMQANWKLLLKAAVNEGFANFRKCLAAMTWAKSFDAFVADVENDAALWEKLQDWVRTTFGARSTRGRVKSATARLYALYRAEGESAMAGGQLERARKKFTRMMSSARRLQMVADVFGVAIFFLTGPFLESRLTRYDDARIGPGHITADGIEDNRVAGTDSANAELAKIIKCAAEQHPDLLAYSKLITSVLEGDATVQTLPHLGWEWSEQTIEAARTTLTESDGEVGTHRLAHSLARLR